MMPSIQNIITEAETILSQNADFFSHNIAMLTKINNPAAISPIPTPTSVPEAAELIHIMPPAVRAAPTVAASPQPHIPLTFIAVFFLLIDLFIDGAYCIRVINMQIYKIFLMTEFSSLNVKSAILGVSESG